jgi:hypothetical protein
MERFHLPPIFPEESTIPENRLTVESGGPKALKAALTSALHNGLMTVINLGNIGDVARFNVAWEPTLQNWLRNFVTPGGFIPYRGTTGCRKSRSAPRSCE